MVVEYEQPERLTVCQRCGLPIHCSVISPVFVSKIKSHNLIAIGHDEDWINGRFSVTSAEISLLDNISTLRSVTRLVASVHIVESRAYV